MESGRSCASAMVFVDEPPVRVAIASMLQRHSFEVESFGISVRGALAAIVRRRPHVVVADVALTGLGGLGVLQSVAKLLPACTIVVLSPFEGLRRRALELGAREVVNPADLRRLAVFLVQLPAGSAQACECCPGTWVNVATGHRGAPGQPVNCVEAALGKPSCDSIRT